MLRHYMQVKSEVPDAILLYRMGDFYETFFEDAVEAAPIFEIQLTARQKGTPSEAPMCGVPHHSVDGYINKLLRAGRKVALCDQVEDPKEAKGLVKREVTRVLTPGTLSELELLDSAVANHLLAIATMPNGEASGALLDISTGSFLGRRWPSNEALLSDLEGWNVAEILVISQTTRPQLLEALRQRVSCLTVESPDHVPRADVAERSLCDQFGIESLAGLGLSADEPLVIAAASALSYAQRNAFSDLPHIETLHVEGDDGVLVLDEATVRNLELFKSASERRKHGSLLWVLDCTRTAAGARLLREWLARPLRRADAIEARLDAVEELSPSTLRDSLAGGLGAVPDLERLVSRAVLGQLNPSEAGALRNGLVAVPQLLAGLSSCSSDQLVGIAGADACSDVAQYLLQWVAAEPPISTKNGGLIASGIDAELDRLRSITADAKQLLLELELREREATGIGNLKVRFNRVFGYYLEVTKSNQHLVPDDYVRKQTLANAERYITEELKELETEILGAEEKQLSLEDSLFVTVREHIAAEHGRLMELARALAQLDVLVAFAQISTNHGYRRPQMTPAGSPLEIDGGRHPVVERTVATDFVPNDALLNQDDARILLITGPNMGGKSTYLRQVALISIMAHCGSFVPANKAQIPLLDRVFTRVGASDNLARGASTFMVEMTETSNILRYATADSLVILDEVGRGTATFDGLSIAWAIVEYLHERIKAKTLFATHYHELTELDGHLDAVQNRAIAVREWEDKIVFLHRVIAGTADQSYGIQVGKLAGLPQQVTERAREVLTNLEKQAFDPQGRAKRARGENAPDSTGADQLTLFARSEDVVAQLLRELDIERLTPLAALNLLETLKKRLE